jgi:hypothetical protein
MKCNIDVALLLNGSFGPQQSGMDHSLPPD